MGGAKACCAAACRRCLLGRDEAPEHAGKIRLDQHVPDFRQLATRKEDPGRGRPFRPHASCHPGEVLEVGGKDRVSLLGQANCGGEDLAQRHRPEFLERKDERTHNGRHGRRQETVARDGVQTVCAKPLGGGLAGRLSLTVHCDDTAVLRAEDEDGNLAPDPETVELGDGLRKDRRDSGVDSVAAGP